MIDQKLESDLSGAQPLRKLRSRRSALEVKMDILTVVRDGAQGPTQIMFKANLSWNLLMQHLKELVESGTLSELNVKNKSIYRLTDKGISVLRSYTLVADNFGMPDHYGMPSLQ
jgi:predicted transcriptional regulator